MAFVTPPRVLETGTGSGTGDVTLLGAVGSGEYDAFNEHLSVNDTTIYVIVDGSQFEIGYGTYSSATPNNGTLTRDTVIRSSSGTSKISLSGSNFNVFHDTPNEAVLVVGPDGSVTNVSAVAGAVIPKDIVTLKALEEPLDNTVVWLGYGVTEGDGLGGKFRWDDGSTATADDINIVQLDAIGAGPGRWIRERDFVWPAEVASDTNPVDTIARRSDTHNLVSNRTDTGYKTIPEVQTVARVASYDTLAALKAVASANWKQGDVIELRGWLADGDLFNPIIAIWQASSTNTDALDVTFIRPTDITGSNPGRFQIAAPPRSQKLTDSDATPSFKDGVFFEGPDVAPAAITAFDDFRDGAFKVLAPGAVDLPINYVPGEIETPSRRTFNLKTRLRGGTPLLLLKDNGVVNFLGGVGGGDTLGVFNVLDYGAVEGGDPADATTNAQAQKDAYDAAVAAGGGIIQWPAGDFYVTNLNAPVGGSSGWNQDRVLSVEADNIFVRGAGMFATKIINADGSNAHMYVWGNRNVGPVAVTGGGISDLTLDGNLANQSPPTLTAGFEDHWSNVSIEDDSSNVVIEHVYSLNAQYYHFGLQRDGISSCRISNCILIGSNADGIDHKNDSGTAAGNIIENVYITDFGKSAAVGTGQAGIDVRPGVSVTNCTVANYGVNASDDVAFRSQRATNSYFTVGQSSSFDQCVASAGGTAATNGTTGFRVIAFQGMTSNCWVRNAATAFHYTGDEPTAVNCVANSCFDGFLLGEAEHATGVYSQCDNGSFTNCSARGGSGRGLRIEGGASFNSFSNCHFRGNDINVRLLTAAGAGGQNAQGNRFDGGSITSPVTTNISDDTPFTAENTFRNVSGVTGTTGNLRSMPFTPTISCTTPGDLAVVYTRQEARYTEVGAEVTIHGTIEATLNHTTASGDVTIAMPFEAATSRQRYYGHLTTGSVPWPATAKAFGIRLNNTADDAQITYDRDGLDVGTLQITDLPSGATVRKFYYSLTYTRR